MTDGTSSLENSELGRDEGRHSGVLLFVGSGMGLCPQTPIGEFPPQTPVSCASQHPPYIGGFVPQPPRPSASKQGSAARYAHSDFRGAYVINTLFERFFGGKDTEFFRNNQTFQRKSLWDGGRMLSIYLFFTLSVAKDGLCIFNKKYLFANLQFCKFAND